MSEEFEDEIARLPQFNKDLMPPSEREGAGPPDSLWVQDYVFYRKMGNAQQLAAECAEIGYKNRQAEIAKRRSDRDDDIRKEAAWAKAFRLKKISDRKSFSASQTFALRELAPKMREKYPSLSEAEAFDLILVQLHRSAEIWNTAVDKSKGDLTLALVSIVDQIMLKMQHGLLAGRERHLDLEKRVSSLVAEEGKSSSNFEYRGVWRADVHYQRNNSATFGGSIWLAKYDNVGLKPGDDNAAWQLAVKAGRDGRDASAEEIAKHLVPEVLRKIERRNG